MTDAILRPTPLIRMWQDWADSCCFKRQPLISLLAGVTTFSAIMSGSYRGPTHAIPPLYTIILAPPGSGKDTPQVMGEELVRACNLDHMLGASTWGSQSGLENELETHNELFTISDEFADILARLTHKNCPGYMQGIATIIKMIFTGRSYRGTALKDPNATKKQEKPRLTLLASATPIAFWQSISPKIITDGLLSRMTVLCAYAPQANDHSRKVLPPGLCIPKDMVEWIQGALPQAVTSPASIGGYKNEKVIPYHDEAAKRKAEEMIDYYDHEAQRRYSSGFEVESALLVRSFERAIKLAAVYAWTERQTDPTVTVAALEWADAIIRASDQQVLACVGDGSSPDDKSTRHWNQYQKIIQGAGPHGIASSVLVARTKLSKPDHESLLKQLIAANAVRITHGKRKGMYIAWNYDHTADDPPEERESLTEA